MTRLDAIEYAESELRNKQINWSTLHIEFYQACLDALREVEQLKNEIRKSKICNIYLFAQYLLCTGLSFL